MGENKHKGSRVAARRFLDEDIMIDDSNKSRISMFQSRIDI